MIFNPMTGLGDPATDKTLYDIPIDPGPLDWREVHAFVHGYRLAQRLLQVPVDDLLNAGWELSPKDGGEEIGGRLTTYQRERHFWSRTRDVMIQARTWGGAGVIQWIDDGRPMSEPVDERNIRGILSYTAADAWELQVHTWGDDPRQWWFNQPQSYRYSPFRRGGGTFSLAQDPREWDEERFRSARIIHASRVLPFVGVPVDPRLQNELPGWGDSVLRALRNRLLDMERTFQISAQILYTFADVVLTDPDLMSALEQYDPQNTVGDTTNTNALRRLRAINISRSVLGMMVLGESGSIQKIASPVSGLDALAEIVMFGLASAGYPAIPVTRLFGISPPGGLNGSGEYDHKVYWESLGSLRTHHVQATIERGVRYQLLAKDGPTGGELVPHEYIPRPFVEQTEAERATNEQSLATTEAIHLENRALHPAEARARLKATKNPIWKVDAKYDDELAAPPPGDDLPPLEPPDTTALETLLNGGDQREDDEETSLDIIAPADVRKAVNAGLFAARGAGYPWPAWERNAAGRLANGKPLSQSQLDQLEILLSDPKHPSACYLGGEALLSWLRSLGQPSPDRLDANDPNLADLPDRWSGLEVHLTHRMGEPRHGALLPCHYGDIPGTLAPDGQPVDCYCGPVPDAADVYVIEQVDPTTGAPDELKVMLGFGNPGAAVATYVQAVDTPARFGGFTTVHADELLGWLADRQPEAAANPLEEITAP